VVEQPESRSSLGVGLDLASRVTTIGLEFALPAAAGYGLDSWLGTKPAATVCGVVLGFIVGMLHAVRMSREMSGSTARPGVPPDRRGRPDQTH
jgi:ATP synthase protein I